MKNLSLTRSIRVSVTLVALTLAAACGRPIDQAMVDARLVVDVRTALVNDPSLGVLPLEVTAAGSVVRIVGAVPSDDDRQRIVTLVKRVPGVRDVETSFDGQVSGVEPPPPPPEPRRSNSPEENDAASAGRFLSLGLGVRLPTGATDDLDPSTRLVPIVRFGRGSHGFGPVISFTGIRADVRDPIDGEDTASRLRIAPLMGGIGYRVNRGRWSVSIAGLAGYGFNSIRVKRDLGTELDRALPISANDSFVVVPTVSIGRDVTSRASLYLLASYLYSRPEITWLEGDRVVNRSLQADTVILSIGFAYWVF